MKSLEIALTIDDGPSAYTEPIIKILQERQVPAHFFVCYENIRRHPQVLNRIIEAYFKIGNHSKRHEFFGTWLGLTRGKILETQKLIDEQVGVQPRIYRAPFGLAQDRLVRQLQEDGFKIAPFGVVGFDWREDFTAEKIANTVVSSVEKGRQQVPFKPNLVDKVSTIIMYGGWRILDRLDPSIIMLHDGDGINPKADRSRTVDALGDIIDKLLSKDYKFVDLDRVMET